jgi:nucleotide-binding universal stress UspA family protein
MIKDVMVRLDGTEADEARIAAGDRIAETFQSHIIGLYINVLPLLIPADGDSAGAIYAAELIQRARQAGDVVEARLTQRLARLQKPVEIRRFDEFTDVIDDVAAREARAADTFVALRPNGEPTDPDDLVEGVLFGSGRHLFLVPYGAEKNVVFERVMVAWNGSRESARALAEALPYLHKASAVTIVAVVDDPQAEWDALVGKDALTHLKHHGINATLHHAKRSDREVGAVLIEEAQRLNAGLIVMGGYGHSRLREWLLGGTTYELMHQAPVPLLVAH